jgi:hypothetical protein
MTQTLLVLFTQDRSPRPHWLASLVTASPTKDYFAKT